MWLGTRKRAQAAASGPGGRLPPPPPPPPPPRERRELRQAQGACRRTWALAPRVPNRTRGPTVLGPQNRTLALRIHSTIRPAGCAHGPSVGAAAAMCTCISLSDRVREHRSDAFYPTDFVCQWAAPRFTECERSPAGVGMHGARKACSNATRRRAKCSSRFHSSGRSLACWIRPIRECRLQCRPPR